jgi:hypothetical protein
MKFIDLNFTIHKETCGTPGPALRGPMARVAHEDVNET